MFQVSVCIRGGEDGQIIQQILVHIKLSSICGLPMGLQSFSRKRRRVRVQPKAKSSTQTRHQQDQEVHVVSSGESDEETRTALQREPVQPVHAVFWDRLSAGPFATAGRFC